MEPSTVDAESCTRHDHKDGQLVLTVLMSKHVDDLNVTGADVFMYSAIHQFEQVLGPLKLSCHRLTNCGVRRTHGERTE